MRIFTLLIAISITFTSCNKDNSSEPSEMHSGVVIIGTISISAQKNALGIAGDSLSLANAKKVLVFSASTFDHGMIFNQVDIDQGAFQASFQIGNATALIFLDSNNRFIGNLNTDGLHMLPLVNLSEGENTVIDLSTLIKYGDHVIPSHNPLGTEILLSPKEVASFKDLDAYYRTLAKNIDTDNNGTPDIINGADIVVHTQFSFIGGYWGTDTSAPTPLDTADIVYNYQMGICGGSRLSFSGGNIELSGPAGNPYTNIEKSSLQIHPFPDLGFIAKFFRADTIARIPEAPFATGRYTLTLDGSSSYTIYYNSVSSKKNMILAVPTLHSDSSGNLYSISVSFRFFDGTSINPLNMLLSMRFQITDSFGRTTNYGSLTRETGFTGYTFRRPIGMSSIYQLDVIYDDLLGNRYLVGWKR